MIKLKMKNHNTILTKKQQKYQQYRQVKLIHEHEYPTGGDILPSDQSIIIEQEKFTYFPVGKVFEK